MKKKTSSVTKRLQSKKKAKLYGLSNTQVLEWRELSISNMNAKLLNGVTQRSKRIEQVVNCCFDETLKWIAGYNEKVECYPFVVSQSTKDEACKIIQARFLEWGNRGGVRLHSCNKRKITKFPEYDRVADNWWNRHKGLWFGETFFGRVFDEVYTYCTEIVGKCLWKDDCRQEYVVDFLFSKCLRALSTANITFRQSRAQSLVYMHCISKKQAFQEQLIEFGQKYGLCLTLSCEHRQAVILSMFKKFCVNLEKAVSYAMLAQEKMHKAGKCEKCAEIPNTCFSILQSNVIQNQIEHAQKTWFMPKHDADGADYNYRLPNSTFATKDFSCSSPYPFWNASTSTTLNRNRKKRDASWNCYCPTRIYCTLCKRRLCDH